MLQATDSSDNTASRGVRIYVTYRWRGWIVIPKMSFTRGATVPVAFRIADTNGAAITDAQAYLTVKKLGGGTLISKKPFTYVAERGEYRCLSGGANGFSTAGWKKGNDKVSVSLGDGVQHVKVLKLKQSMTLIK